jgi:hypothetical protein
MEEGPSRQDLQAELFRDTMELCDIMENLNRSVASLSERVETPPRLPSTPSPLLALRRAMTSPMGVTLSGSPGWSR